MIVRLTLTAATLVILTGCEASLGTRPIPQRLTADRQQAYEHGWSHLAANERDVTREELLDAILLRQAWQQGVDVFEMRSEKKVGAMRIVIETSYHRDDPNSDAVRVAFYDGGPEPFRTEHYPSSEVDAAIDLYLTANFKPEDETPLQAAAREARQAELEYRLRRAIAVFPQPAGSEPLVPGAPLKIHVADDNPLGEMQAIADANNTAGIE